MTDLEPIEPHLRLGEVLDLESDVVIRGSPLTVEGLLRNADATRRRYSFRAEPLAAVSVEVAFGRYDVDSILSGPRMRTRRSYVAVGVGAAVAGGFELLPTFGAPHYSVNLGSYTEEAAERLMAVLGDAASNPHHRRREP